MNRHDEEIWILHYYGEPLTVADERRFVDDLEFRRGYEEFRKQLDWVDRVGQDPANSPALQPDSGIADRVWDSLRPQLSDDAESSSQTDPTTVLRSDRWRRWKPATAILAAAAGLLVVFLIGVRFGEESATLTAAQQRQLSGLAIDRHLRNSGNLLIELTNLRPSATGRDIDIERNRAELLASDNRLYRQSLGEDGDRATLETLELLEGVLTELANLSDEAEPTEILALRRRVQRLGLLLRLQLLEDLPAGAGSSRSALPHGEQV